MRQAWITGWFAMLSGWYPLPICSTAGRVMLYCYIEVQQNGRVMLYCYIEAQQNGRVMLYCHLYTQAQQSGLPEYPLVCIKYCDWVFYLVHSQPLPMCMQGGSAA